MVRPWAVALGFVVLVSAGAAGADLLPASAPVQAICQPWVSSPCVARVGASVQAERSGLPLAGKRLWFVTSDGAPICSSVTDRAGAASCHGIARSGRTLAESGYRVVFEGDGRYERSVVRAR